VVEGLFCWGFCEKWCVDVVFLWSSCGELRGKRGQRMVAFQGWKFGTFLKFIFRRSRDELKRQRRLALQEEATDRVFACQADRDLAGLAGFFVGAGSGKQLNTAPIGLIPTHALIGIPGS